MGHVRSKKKLLKLRLSDNDECNSVHEEGEQTPIHMITKLLSALYSPILRFLIITAQKTLSLTYHF